MDNQVEKNKAICKVFLDELFNQKNIDAIDQFVDHHVSIQNPFPGQRTGADGFRDISQIYGLAFPDLKISFNHILGDADQVTCHFTLEGTHKDLFMNIPATGIKVRYDIVYILKFTNEKITAHWSLVDGLSVLQQIGAISLT
ncbi:ester cyclase [Pedobacter psychrotolerans]|jgi:predicted ester cyclase|uniref:ester cyclase n=1 Tax=Pedobacter psychrotolerans TaxID=1843235 RepID=UPI003F9D35E4